MVSYTTVSFSVFVICKTCTGACICTCTCECDNVWIHVCIAWPIVVGAWSMAGTLW